MRPPIPRKYDAPAPKKSSYKPIIGHARQHHLSKPNPNRPLVYLADGITLTQETNLLALPGQIGFAGDRPQDNCSRPLPLGSEDRTGMDSATDNSIFIFTNEIVIDPQAHAETLVGPSRHQRRRENQANRWLLTVIPSLIRPYMRLMQQTESLRKNLVVETGETSECTCNKDRVRHLKILVVRFHALETLEIVSCRCLPAAKQLIVFGLFPCAPIAPTLAVDIRVLEFVTRLFLNIPPNTTAWCKTIEDFLQSQGYQLSTKDSLRKRFGECLRWFNTLQDKTESHIDTVLYHTRRLATPYDDGIQESQRDQNPDDSMSNEPGSASQSGPSVSETRPHASAGKRSFPEVNSDESENPFPEPNPRTRPSDYLRSRCPLCFGGKFPRPAECSGPDVIICIDACFKQKRNAGEKDPPRSHPGSLFLPDSATRCMEEYVETIRPSQQSKRATKSAKKGRRDTVSSRLEDMENEDGYDGPMEVPRSILASCQESFYAADEHRKKASTQFFSETGLMALLCRHDRVLWITSMTSAGEKQYYALALIETFFQNVPPSLKAGILYDIGCQMHQSCVKWGFLKRYQSRITFAISVFHAFGHQWACQIIYHPRKRAGFGLSDGEGCERLWKSLQTLIPYLRVCGHYQRIYTLDRQILHAEKQSLSRFAFWLQRRTYHCQEKRQEAEGVLSRCGYSIHILREQWELQRKSQTKPLPRQSKNSGRNAIEDALRLRKTRDVLMEQISSYQAIIMDESSEDHAVAEAELRLEEAKSKLKQAQNKVKAAEDALGVNDRTRLRNLINNPFISARMNARALKMRLRDKLRARKFELEVLERSFRHQVNEQKVDEHTESSVQRRDPGIQKIARDYNSLCKRMQTLKNQGKAPRGAICPLEIEMSGLFALDVDDEIWQDIGLDDSLDHSGQGPQTLPPLWLCNDGVRSGIKAMLELDRCIEEENRLSWERSSLQVWFAEEWEIVCEASDATDSVELLYSLNLRKSNLVSLLVGWQKSLRTLLPLLSALDDLPSGSWGPTDDDILKARVLEVTPLTVGTRNVVVHDQGQRWDSESDDDSIASDFSVDDMSTMDSTLLNTLEAVDLADAFREDLNM